MVGRVVAFLKSFPHPTPTASTRRRRTPSVPWTTPGTGTSASQRSASRPYTGTVQGNLQIEHAQNLLQETSSLTSSSSSSNACRKSRQLPDYRLQNLVHVQNQVLEASYEECRNKLEKVTGKPQGKQKKKEVSLPSGSPPFCTATRPKHGAHRNFNVPRINQTY